MAKYILKVKTKSGHHLVVDHLSNLSSLCQLKEFIAPHVDIPLEKLIIMTGYPPKALKVSDEEATLDEAGLRSGESLLVEESTVPQSDQVPSPGSVTGPKDKNSQVKRHVASDDADGGVLLRQVVPADNSCLFTSIGFVLGGKVDTSCGSFMRQIIAEQVASDEEMYSEGILGKPNKEYCKWILKPESWGGAIELAILSHYYGIEIAVIDTMNTVINRFGEDKDYEYRVFLVFDGIHYDPIYRETFGDEPKIQTMFLKSNLRALHDAEELAHEAKSSRQYTDVNRFSLRCLICQVLLQGQAQAQAHAQKTGHMNFGEVSS